MVYRTKGYRISPEKLRFLRQYLRMTQLEFAEDLGVHVRTVASWETGIQYPRIETTRAILRLADHHCLGYYMGPAEKGLFTRLYGSRYRIKEEKQLEALRK